MTIPVAEMYLQIRHEFWLSQKLPVKWNTKKGKEVKVPTTQH